MFSFSFLFGPWQRDDAEDSGPDDELLLANGDSLMLEGSTDNLLFEEVT